MIAAWYGRMNQRERILVFAIAGLIFVLLNLLIWSWLLGAIGRAHAGLVARKARRKEKTFYI
jgi:hypothetical protein